jgi:hypothetical protein
MTGKPRGTVRSAVLAGAVLVLLAVPAAFPADLPAPTTTLSAETANNTSAAAAFVAEPNGNMAGANISKLPIRSLLYPGSTTRLYAHVEPWWGSSHHIDIGYRTATPALKTYTISITASSGSVTRTTAVNLTVQ